MAEWIVMDNPPPDDVDWEWPKVCEAGIDSHEWRLVLDDGAKTLQSDCDDCSAVLNFMLGEAMVVADIPVALTWESCGNSGGWHGAERCDCDAYWIVAAKAEPVITTKDQP